MTNTPETATVAIPRTEGELIAGTCKAWNVEKGFGFLKCGDNGEDIFIHQSAIHLSESRFRAVLPGSALVVTYTLRTGKATCSKCTGPDGAALPGFETKLIATQQISRATSDPGSKFGKCKWFNAEKGYGFIVPEDGTEDVFVNIKEVNGGAALVPECPVQYVLGKQPDGRDRATKVKNLGAPQAAAAPQQQAFFPQQPYNPYGGVQPYPQFSPYGMPVQAAVGPNGQKTGTIKWFNEERGFGFIIPTGGGTEIYFKDNAIQGGGGLLEGDPVDFEEKTADGKVWASSVVNTKNRKRKAPGFEAYGEANPAMFKAPRQAYGAPQPGQPVAGQHYDPYGQPAGAAAPAAGTSQYPAQYEAYGQPGAPQAPYQQGPPAQHAARPNGQAYGEQAAAGAGFYPPGPYY